MIKLLFCYIVIIVSVLESCIYASSIFLLNHKLSIKNVVDTDLQYGILNLEKDLCIHKKNSNLENSVITG